MTYTTELLTKSYTLDRKEILYNNETQFLVQIDKEKGSYTTLWTIVGDLPEALRAYNTITIDNMHIYKATKKRLLMPSSENPILARKTRFWS